MKEHARIVLVASPVFRIERLQPYVPLGLLSLASEIRNAGHDVSIVEFGGITAFDRAWESGDFIREAAAYLVDGDWDVIGFSTMGSAYSLMLRLAGAVRGSSNGKPIVFGGPHATVTAEETLAAFPQVDFILRGEAEESFLQLVRHLIDGEPALEAVGGLCWRGTDGEVHARPPAQIDGLDSLRLPSYDVLDGTIRDRLRRDGIPLELARGCPFKCIYCYSNSASAPSFRAKSNEQIIGELEELHRCYGFDNFAFINDTFTSNPANVEDFCERLGRVGFSITWKCSSRPDRLDTRTLKRMREAGCTGIFCGIESGSARMQDVLCKNIDLLHAEDIVVEASRMGFRVYASFLHGIPGESERDLGLTLRLAAWFVINGVESVHSHLLAVYPGTPLFDMYRGKLYRGEYVSDQASNRIWDPVDGEMIDAFPNIFSLFYRMPTILPERILSSVSGYISVVMRFFACTHIALCGDDPESYYRVFLEFVDTGAVDLTDARENIMKIVREFTGFVRRRFDTDRPWLESIVAYESALARIGLMAVTPEERDAETLLDELKSRGKVDVHAAATVLHSDYDTAALCGSIRKARTLDAGRPERSPGSFIIYRGTDRKVYTARMPAAFAGSIDVHQRGLRIVKRREADAGEIVHAILSWMSGEGILPGPERESRVE